MVFLAWGYLAPLLVVNNVRVVTVSYTHLLKQCYCDDAKSLSQLYLDVKKDYLMFPVFNKIFNFIVQ